MMEFWKFKKFTMKFQWRGKWKRNNPEIREELMLMSNNIDPLTGITFPENQVHFSSRNSWYHWKRYDIWVAKGESNSWSMQLFPTAENPYSPYAEEHMRFEVFKTL
tara:strand:- start:20769 stop:21086 length:318 start_codon:yes stop_codon:yes gene_type:complete